MNVYGSGFIIIINYSGIADSSGEQFELLTENNNDILTELSQEILTEASP